MQTLQGLAAKFLMTMKEQPSASPPSTMTASCGPSSRCIFRPFSLSTASRHWRRSIGVRTTQETFASVLKEGTPIAIQPHMGKRDWKTVFVVTASR
jgi:hypothetical protein